MVSRVLIIGGYGNFGSYIARALATHPNIVLVICGRSQAKAQQFAKGLDSYHPAEGIALDIRGDISTSLALAKPDIVIHTTGPFQDQTFVVAEACIARGCHYIDLADARDFVTNISSLDGSARANQVAVVSGASSVPCLTAAIVDAYRPHFQRLLEIDYAITAAQQTNRGLATLSSILSYVGRPFTTLIDGTPRPVYGWQNLHRHAYPGLARRWLGNCDIPDLKLFPSRYPELATLRFFAGAEIGLLHLGLWFLSWLVRWRLLSLPPLAPALLRIAFAFDRFGSGNSGFHMFLRGVGADGRRKEERLYIIARSGHGPYIPCMPAILLAKRIAEGDPLAPGARPCLDLIDLDTYLQALEGLDIVVLK